MSSVEGRTKKAIRNSIWGVVSYVITALLTFVSQRFFIVALGYDVLGLNAVFNTIITTLSIAELGIGTAIAFSLYKPLSENDENTVALLVKLYRKIFWVIGFVVLGAGLIIIPLLPVFVGSAFTIEEIIIPYLLCLSNSFLSYLFTYNHTLLTADQKNYVVSIVNFLTKIVLNGLQIVTLLLVPNYILFMSILLAVNAMSNLMLSSYTRKKYSYIKSAVGELSAESKSEIKNNVFALVFHRIGNYLVTGTDNLIISGVLGVAFAGYYSNYTTITVALTSVMLSLFLGVVAGFGNLLIEQGKDYVRIVFKRVVFLNYLITTVLTAGFFVVANEFIVIWTSSSVALQPMVFMVFITINFYITNYASVQGNLRAAAGAFAPDKYLHIFIALLNLVLSLGLVYVMGISGVLLGTTVSLVIKECIVLPHICHKYVYGGKKSEYYLKLIYDFLVAGICCAVAYFVCGFIVVDNLILSFVLKGLVTVAITVIILLAFNLKTEAFNYYLGAIKGKLLKK